MYDKCRRYAVDWNLILQDFDIDSIVPNETWPLQNCDKGWEYNTTDVQSSIVIDVRTNFFLIFPRLLANINFIISYFFSFFSFWIRLKFNKQLLVPPHVTWRHSNEQYDLVCDKDIYPTLGLVALNIGGPIGVYLFGVLNDRAGRRISYFSCLATLLTGSFITAFSSSFGVWAFSRIIVGLTIPAVYQIPFIIGK